MMIYAASPSRPMISIPLTQLVLMAGLINKTMLLIEPSSRILFKIMKDPVGQLGFTDLSLRITLRSMRTPTLRPSKTLKKFGLISRTNSMTGEKLILKTKPKNCPKICTTWRRANWNQTESKSLTSHNSSLKATMATLSNRNSSLRCMSSSRGWEKPKNQLFKIRKSRNKGTFPGTRTFPKV